MALYYKVSADGRTRHYGDVAGDAFLKNKVKARNRNIEALRKYIEYPDVTREGLAAFMGGAADWQEIVSREDEPELYGRLARLELSIGSSN